MVQDFPEGLGFQVNPKHHFVQMVLLLQGLQLSLDHLLLLQDQKHLQNLDFQVIQLGLYLLLRQWGQKDQDLQQDLPNQIAQENHWFRAIPEFLEFLMHRHCQQDLCHLEVPFVQ